MMSLLALLMSLRKQLNDMLTMLLPPNPVDSIKGTELIRLVRLQLDGNYSDASLRYHFSIMSCDATSAIAKVEKGQGYYRRGNPAPALASAQELLSLSQGRLDDLQENVETFDVVMLRIRKFRAIVKRYYELNGRLPFIFRESFKKESPLGNLWKYPDIVLTDWETSDDQDDAMRLDAAFVRMKQRMGAPPLGIHAARLRIQSSLQTYREDLFQTLAVSQWAQGGELIYAAPITDEALADGLRHLSGSFGVGVTSFGLTTDVIDELPRPAQILNGHPREIEAIINCLDITRIAAAKIRPHLDWQELHRLRSESQEVRGMLEWIDDCLENGRAKPFVEGK